MIAHPPSPTSLPSQPTLYSKPMQGALRVQAILQDRYHVGHSITPLFNNTHPLFWELSIKRLRDLTTDPEKGYEELVDQALLHGQIAKKVRPPRHVHPKTHL